MFHFLTKSQKNIFSAACVLGSFGLASSILGFIRSRLLAGYFGASDELGIYFAAFQIPSSIFEILVLGTFSSSFIPIFSQYIKEKKQEGWHVASSVGAVILFLLLFLGLVFFLFTKQISQLIAPGFSLEEIQLMVPLSRIVFLSQIFLFLAVFETAILQSYKKFVLSSLAFPFYNLGTILLILWKSKEWGVFAPTWGIVFGAFLYWIIQGPLIFKLGFKLFSFKFKKDETIQVIKLMLPRALNVVFNKIDATVSVLLASLISAASLVPFNFAQQLQFAPVSLVGSTIGQASLPTLSLAALDKNPEGHRQLLQRTLLQLLFITVPISIFILVLRLPLVRLFFGAAKFDWPATILTGYTLATFSISIFAQSAIQFLSRGFYSLKDTATPVTINISSMILNIILSIIFLRILKFDVWALGLSTSAAAFVNFFLLLVFLDKKVKSFFNFNFIVSFAKIALASLLMGTVMYVSLKILDRGGWGRQIPIDSFLLPVSFEKFILDTRYTINLIVLSSCVSLIGGVIYFVSCYIFQVEELRLVTKIWRNIKTISKFKTKNEL